MPRFELVTNDNTPANIVSIAFTFGLLSIKFFKMLFV